jgi:hypothetical protein
MKVEGSSRLGGPCLVILIFVWRRAAEKLGAVAMLSGKLLKISIEQKEES